MASLTRDKNGTKRIQFMFAKGDRRTIRLGKINVKAGEKFLIRIEHLISAIQTATPIDLQTAQWLAELADETYDKLAQAGLAEPREQVEAKTLGVMLDEYFATMSVKESTRIRYAQTKRLLIEYFGNNRQLDSIASLDGDKWRAWLSERGYAEAKIGRDVRGARMFFKKGVQWGMIPSNPFEDVKAGRTTNRKKAFFVTPEATFKIIEACPDADWRCIVALARFGGLRCPSEVLAVRWADVDWANNRFRVRSPKTEHHQGKAERMVPLFPELRDVLMQAFECAPEGAEFVVGRYRDQTANLGTHMRRIIERAGMQTWPKLFNNMRASRATELDALYPSAQCTAWMGHSQAIAEAHYHMVRDEDFERAASTPIALKQPEKGRSECVSLDAHFASQQQSATSGKEEQNRAQIEKGSALMPTLSTLCSSLQFLSEPSNGHTRT
jgi:integrase